MKAYQCSKCEHLEDIDVCCICVIGIDPRPGYREKDDAKKCRDNFKALPEEKEWHTKFSWE